MQRGPILFSRGLRNLKRYYRKLVLDDKQSRNDADRKHQALLVHTFSYAGILIGIGYGIHSLLGGHITTATVVLFSVLFLSVCLIFATVKRQQQIAVLGGIMSYGLLSVYLLVTGGVENTGALWSYPFPIAAVSWLNRKQSVVAIAIFFIVAACVLLMPGDALLRASYSDNFRFRYLGSLFLVSLSSYLVERTRRSNHRRLKKENEMRKKTQKELLRALNAANEASKAKSIFLANMSNEFRTPLGSIIGLTDLISQAEINEPYRDYLRATRLNADLLLSTINDILDYSKLQAGEFELEIREFDIHRIVENIADSLSAPAFEKGLELACLVRRDVPSRLIGDPSRLRQILINLTSNAIKFTDEGTVTVRISLDEKHSDHCLVRFEVSDTGIGVPRDKIESLFHAFSQVDTSTTRKHGGTGLGLAICRKLVDAMDGSIGVKSQDGTGSQFWFTARFDLTETVDTTLPHFFTFSGARILAVCRDQLNADIVCEGLARTGCDIDSVTDNKRSLSLIAESASAAKPYAAMIIEARSPSVSVGKIAAQIRACFSEKRPKLILILAQGEIIDPAQMEEYGVSEYVVKPIRVSALRKAVGRALGKIKHDDIARHQHFVPVFKPLLFEKGSTNGQVLIVEDDATLRTVVRGYLSDFNLPSREATDGRQALDLLRRENYLLVLMDMQMPELDGLQATRLIRDRAACVKNHLTPIIGMAAHSFKGDRERLIAIGMNDYISKPVRKEDLYTVIARQLSVRISLTPRPPTTPPEPLTGRLDSQDLIEQL